MASSVEQLELPLAPLLGGARRGAGRRRTPGRRPGVAHVSRPEHRRAHPALVTLRARPELRCLRADRVFPHLKEALSKVSTESFRMIHFSIQADHVHLIVEAEGREALSRGMNGLAVRLARGINRVLGRAGKVWDDRYHARALANPRAVRNAIVYVLMNWKKHLTPGRRSDALGSTSLDPCSSADSFDGWATREARSGRARDIVVASPRTWLASIGWRRGALVSLAERPSEKPVKRLVRSTFKDR